MVGYHDVHQACTRVCVRTCVRVVAARRSARNQRTLGQSCQSCQLRHVAYVRTHAPCSQSCASRARTYADSLELKAVRRIQVHTYRCQGDQPRPGPL